MGVLLGAVGRMGMGRRGFGGDDALSVWSWGGFCLRVVCLGLHKGLELRGIRAD